jgi:hypothetical protein
MTVAVLLVAQSFRGARSANPESRLRFKTLWIPGSPLARRPGMTSEWF